MKQIINSLKIVVLIAMMSFAGACTTDSLEPSLEQNKTMSSAIDNAESVKNFLKGALDALTSPEYYGRNFIINNEIRTNCFANGKSGRFSTSCSFKYLDTDGTFFWGQAYKAINLANLIIEADISSFKVKDKELYENYKGQAYALRALIHYDLLTVYGQQNVTGGTLGIPYMKEFISASSPEDAFFPKRNTIEETKASIFEDLTEAYKILTGSGKSSDDPVDNVFLSALATKAIEARVALYFGMWQEAQDAANIVISSGTYSIMPATEYVASWAGKKNKNSIFELPFSATDNNGIRGLAYMYRNIAKGYGDASLLPGLRESLYDAADVRLKILGEEKWEERTYVTNDKKYPDTKQGSDNIPVIRYEEIVLTSAEALLELGKTAEALVQLNALAKERGIADYTEATKENILKERRREFLFEGIYFNDMMRTKQSLVARERGEDQMPTVETPIPYGDYRLAWPISKREMDANSNMVQNEGY